MRCPRCGETLVAREKCRVCGHELPAQALGTARLSSHYRDPSQWERQLLIRVGAEPVELVPGQVFTVGRSSDCDLTINSKSVSRQHARIEWDDEGRAVLRDQGSENGCVVNGVRVSERLLEDGDEVAFGPYVVAYRRVQAVGSVQETNELLDSHSETQPMQAAALSGRLTEVSLYEILETLHFNGRTGTLEIFGAAGAEGQVGLLDGRAVYAYARDKGDQESVGKDAVLLMLGWTEGLFGFTTELDKKPPNLRAALPAILEEHRRRLPGVKDYAHSEGGPPQTDTRATSKQRPPTGAQRRPPGPQRRRPTGAQRRPPGRKGPPRRGRPR